MVSARVPAFHASGRWWSPDEVSALASGYHAALAERLREATAIGVVLPASVDGLALLLAASACPVPVVVFGDDPSAWPDHAPGMLDLPLVLGPSRAPLADEAVRRGFRPLPLPAPTSPLSGVSWLCTPGFVVHTSGSTGRPKPVFRPTDRIVRGATARARALGLAAGAGFVGGVSYAAGQGLVQAVSAIAMGVPLGMLGPVDYREALHTISQPEFGCWRATAQFADLLSRTPIDAIPPVPQACLVSSPIADAVHEAFLRRFGVPLRGAYSSTETGAVAVDGAPADAVQRGTVGLPLDGVSLAIGERPGAPVDAGETGRVWVRSPWVMAGYGMPPGTERPGEEDGWWPTRDLGSVGADGTLRLRGRLDDCIRTRAGRLVNLDAVASAMRACPGVVEAVVLPLDGPAGPTFGAVVECRSPERADEVRRAIGGGVPTWALPRRLHLVAAVPRLGNGKPDRIGCLAMLHGEALPA